MDALTNSFSHLELSQIVAKAPRPVQKAIMGQLDQLDILRLVTTLKPPDITLLARAIAIIQGAEQDHGAKQLCTLAINVLMMKEEKTYPFLAQVMASLSSNTVALTMAHVVVNNGTHDQMEAILGDDALTPEHMVSLVRIDRELVSDKVVSVASKLWELESCFYNDPTKEESKIQGMLKQQPLFEEYLETRHEHSGPAASKWLKWELTLMRHNNNDLLHVSRDWPSQRVWLEQHKGLINKAKETTSLSSICSTMRQQLVEMHNYPSQGIRLACPALTFHDLDRLDLLVTKCRSWQLQKTKTALVAVVDSVLARHDALVRFPECERKITAANDKEIIKLTSDEFATLRSEYAKLAAIKPKDKESICTLLGDIELYKFRTKQVLRCTSKHLQHLLFTRHAGLFSIHALHHLDFCPKLRNKVEASITESLGDDGAQLLTHYRWLRKASRELAHQFDKVEVLLKNLLGTI